MGDHIIENRKFVITGGPGAGKTSVCAHLATMNIEIVPESGRTVIQRQRNTGGTALPWIDPLAFASEITLLDRRNYDLADQQGGASLFDRGFPDNAGYLRMLGYPVSKELDRYCEENRYQQTVFIAPPWPEIYRNDDARQQSYSEAVRTFDAMSESYLRYGYRLETLARTSIEHRAAMILDKIVAQ